MATAVQTANEPNTSPAKSGSNLLVASVIGAAFILTGIVVAGFGVPKLLGGISLGNSFTSAFIRILAQLGVIGVWAYVGGRLAGDNPPKGLRGGIFLVISVVIAWFFLTRAVGLIFGNPIVGGVAAIGFAFLGFRFLTGKTGKNAMITIEEQGWLHTTQYKRSQGRRLRQYTIGGILLIGLSGVWSMLRAESIGKGDLVFELPFDLPSFTALTDKQYAVPLLLAAAVGWLAWRLVNIPMFADFLIATEAEMNKVAWSTRKKLVQDTIVVLVTTVLLTVFLLVIDLFWGWLLSDVLSVLPKPKTDGKAKDPTQQVDW